IAAIAVTVSAAAQPNTSDIPDSLRSRTAPAADTVKPWKFDGNIGVNFSQVALKDWAGGGKNTVALLGLVAVGANYSQDVYGWNNSLELGYGVTKLGDDPFRKSDDR